MSEKRFDIIKPVENHSEELCCTECWQRGINWGGDGERERIIALLEETSYCGSHNEIIALIKGENNG